MKQENHFQSIDKLRSILHGANIQRGQNDIERVVLNYLIDCGLDAAKGRKISITHETQKSYKPDIILEMEDVTYLIDTKSDGYNNNTPISDTAKKYCAALESMQKTGNKRIEFIFLTFFTKSKNLKHLSEAYGRFGLTYIEGNVWLEKITNKNVCIEDILFETHEQNKAKRIKNELGNSGIREIISYLENLEDKEE